jgi:hypothetical protein
MSPTVNHRPKWQIDEVLEGLIGQDIRVAVESFSPSGSSPRIFVASRNLVLPDNSRVDGLPLYFEGKLHQFVREIGVVHVDLEAPASQEHCAEGIVCFRGTTAAVLRGPATVRLAHPFRVERLPADPESYWADLRFPRAQFQLPL